MQTNDFCENVLYIHVNRFPSKKSFQGLSIILNGCAERHLLLNMSSPTTLVQQAEAGGRNEKNLHKRSAEAFFRDGHTLGAC